MPSYKVTFWVNADSDAEAADFAALKLPEYTRIVVEPMSPYETVGSSE